MYVCAHACVHACMHACMCMHACICISAYVSVHLLHSYLFTIIIKINMSCTGTLYLSIYLLGFRHLNQMLLQSISTRLGKQ